VTAKDVVASGNNVGFSSDGAQTQLNLENCVAGANATGVLAVTGTIRLSNCAIFANTTNGISGPAALLLTFGNNKIGGNVGSNGGPGTMTAASPGQQ
jgi:hypothetical protein